MTMEKLNVKDLQQLCKQAGLKTTGKKAALIERLQGFHSAHSIMLDNSKEQLVKRVAELEGTVAQLNEQLQSDGDSSIANPNEQPPSKEFRPQMVSSPKNTQSEVVPGSLIQNHQPTLHTNVPFCVNATTLPVVSVVNSLPLYSNTIPTYMSQYAQPGIQMPRHTIAPSVHWNPGVFGAPVSTTPSFYGSPITMSTAPMLPNVVTAQPLAPPIVPEAGFRHISDILAILPEFDPLKENSLSAGQFIQRVHLLKNAYQWRDDLLVFAVQQKLKGHAKLWIDAQPEIITSWYQFSQLLINAFPCEDNAADAHIKMSNMKRGVNETPQEYFYKMWSQGTKYGLLENAIARHIVNGINDYDLKRKISNDYTTCAELLTDIDSYCRYNQIRNPIKQTTTTTNSFQKTNLDKPMRTTPNYTDKSSIKCYNCGKQGHISLKCPEPQKIPRCQHCHKTSHASRDCTLAKTTANVNKLKTSLENKPDLIKQVHIKDWSGNAVVDSGSDRTLMRKSVGHTIGPVEQCNVTLHGFAGGQYVCPEAVNVNIVTDGVEQTAQVLLVDDKLLADDMLLGRDVLCQPGKRLVIEEDECWFETIETAKCLPSLPPHEQKQLKLLLAKHRDCFAENAQELGECKIAEMEIKVSTDVPINVKPYRIAFAKRERAQELVNELLSAKIIERSESEYASPVVLVPKDETDLRLCVDYRQLNRITVRVPFPLPILEEQFASLAGNTYFTSMGLRMGYHQVKVARESQKFTAFVTTDGHYQYTRMPFGLVNAPATFQKIMNMVVSRLPPGEMMAYLDDVVIPSTTVEEGLERLEKALKALREAGLTLRLDKCKFLHTKITYLGHNIGKDNITPGEMKTDAVRNFNQPTNVTEVRRFLGLTGFFRKFIPNYAVISKPLTMLLHKSEVNKFNWDAAQNESFKTLKLLLCDKPVLSLYDFTAQHEVHTDASSLGLAGVLLQSSDEKNWHAVFYYSRHCTDAETRYHAYELEVLAVVETLTRFRIYLLGKRFRLVTDCAAISKARAQKELIPKIARWYLKMMEFDFEVIHRPGQQLAHVDALSRAPNEPSSEIKPAGFVHTVHIDENDWLLTMQLQDEKLKRIILVLRGEIKDDQLTQIKKEFVLKNSRLFRKDAEALKFVVPKAVRWRIVKKCHDDAGHFGTEKTILAIKKHFWFPRMRKYVKSYLAACVECCYSKAHSGKTEGQMHYGNVDPLPFRTLHLDHLGPFVKSGRGMQYVLAISDAFTKYLLIKAVRNTKTGPVLTTLNEMTTYFGLPRRIITDRGTAFTSKQFIDYCIKNNIQHVKTAVRTPRANGQVERANQTILATLRTSNTKSKDWDLNLREIQWFVNSQKNATTKFCPNELIFDFDLRDIIGNKIVEALHNEEEPERLQNIEEKRQQALNNIDEERAKWKIRFDQRHASPTTYSVDDLVVLEHIPPASGESRKLEPKYRGPYMVTAVLENDPYVVADIPGMQISQRRFESVYSSDKLRRWCRSCPELDDNTEEEDSDVEDDINAGLAELSATPCVSDQLTT